MPTLNGTVVETLVDRIASYPDVRDAIEIARQITNTPEIGARFRDEQLARLRRLVAACDEMDKELKPFRPEGLT